METWRLTGKNWKEYDYGTLPAADGERERGFLALKPDISQPGGFGALVQSFEPVTFRGKRVRFSAEVRTDGVTDWSGLWMRLDREAKQDVIALDNMHNRPITGTTGWQRYEIVLEVPQDAKRLLYGLLLCGEGRAEVSNVQLDEVAADVPVTATPRKK
jgi:hypothetical protein